MAWVDLGDAVVEARELLAGVTFADSLAGGWAAAAAVANGWHRRCSTHATLTKHVAGAWDRFWPHSSTAC